MKRVVCIIGGALLMAACSEAPSAPAAPKSTPVERPSFDLTCKSGYVIAYDEEGNPYCAPDQEHRLGVFRP